MSEYQGIKDQLKFETGKQEIVCPHCSKPGARAQVSRPTAYDGRRARFVRTTCKHCGTNYSFIWWNPLGTK